jgi:UDP-glucose 4-epimerase
MKRVLVTGGCGFIGSHIVEELLEQNYEVIIVDNLKTGKLQNINTDKVKFFQCDIRSKDLENIVADTMPEYIIHQAAQVSVSESITNITNDSEINIIGTIKVIEAARKNRVKKIVFASSAAVYGEPQYLPIDIKHPCNPISPYGLSKYTVEEYLKMTKTLFGIDYTILRYSNVYGPRQNTNGEGGVVAVFCESFSNDKEVKIFGDGEQTRDFIFVKDVAKANIRALEMGDNQIFNISSSEMISINNIFLLIKEISCSFITPSYEKVREGDIKHSSLCNKLAEELLNWAPEYDLKIGLEKTVMYYNNLLIKQ